MKRLFDRLRYCYRFDLAPRRITRRFQEHGETILAGVCGLGAGAGCFCLGVVRVVGGMAAVLLEPFLTFLRPLKNCLFDAKAVDELRRRFDQPPPPL